MLRVFTKFSDLELDSDFDLNLLAAILAGKA